MLLYCYKNASHNPIISFLIDSYFPPKIRFKAIPSPVEINNDAICFSDKVDFISPLFFVFLITPIQAFLSFSR